VSYEELEKMLYSTLKSKENLNGLCEELLSRYIELNEKHLLHG